MAKQNKCGLNQGNTGRPAWARLPVFLAEGQNARLAAVALCFAAGLNRRIRWNSMRDAARELGYTVAEISKLTLRAQDALGLPRNVNNKKPEHANTYSAVQAANPWRSRKFKL